jgi:hypothetical protein
VTRRLGATAGRRGQLRGLYDKPRCSPRAASFAIKIARGSARRPIIISPPCAKTKLLRASA